MQVWRKRFAISFSILMIASQIFSAHSFLNGDISSRRIRREGLVYTIPHINPDYLNVLNKINNRGSCKKILQLPINSANYDFIGSIMGGIYIGSSIYRELYGCQDINGLFKIENQLLLSYVRIGDVDEFKNLICNQSIDYIVISKNLLPMSYDNKFISMFFQGPPTLPTRDEQIKFIEKIKNGILYENEDYALVDACKI